MFVGIYFLYLYEKQKLYVIYDKVFIVGILDAYTGKKIDRLLGKWRQSMWFPCYY